MAHGQFEKVMEDVKALSPEEQRQLWAWLDRICAPASASMTEEEFAHQLRAAGLLSEVKAPIPDFTPYQHRQPIEVTGKPLSEVIIEERRQVAVYCIDSSAVVLVEQLRAKIMPVRERCLARA